MFKTKVILCPEESRAVRLSHGAHLGSIYTIYTRQTCTLSSNNISSEKYLSFTDEPRPENHPE